MTPASNAPDSALKPPKDDRAGWLLLGAILLAATPVALCFSIASPILPKMAADLGRRASDAYLVKMVQGVMGFAMVLGAALAGVLADRLGRRWLLIGAGLVFAVAGAAPFLLTSLPLILLARFVAGAAAVSTGVAGAALLADRFEGADRTRWMGLFEAVAMGGGLIALFAAGMMGDLGWRWPFLLCLIGAPMAALALATPGRRPATSGVEPADAPGARRAKLPWGLALFAFLIGFITYSPSIYLPFRLAHLGVVNPSAVGMCLMSSVVVSTIASSLFGRVRRVLSTASVFGLSFAAVAVGVGTTAVAPDLTVALVGLGFLGLGVGWMAPNLTAASAGAADGAHRGRSIGLVRAAHSLAPIIGVAAMEPVSKSLGVEAVLLLSAAVAAVMAAAVLLTRGAFKAPLQPSLETPEPQT